MCSAPQPILNLIRPNETAYDLLRRFHAPSQWDTGLPVLQLSAGDVVEIFGESGGAKTEMLMHVAATCALPRSAGGQESPVIYFDHDCHLEPLRLRRIVRRQLERASTRCSNATASASASTPAPASLPPCSDIDAACVQCMSRIHVFRCSSSFEFLASLVALRRGPLLHSGDSDSAAALLVIDSLASFHWQDKLTESVAGAGAALLPQVPDAILQVVRESAVAVLAAKPKLFEGKNGAPHAEYTDRKWSKAVHQRIYVEHIGTTVRATRVALQHAHAHTKAQTQPQLPCRSCDFAVTDDGVLVRAVDGVAVATTQ